MKPEKILVSSILLVLILSISHVFAQPKGTYESDNFKITNMSAIYKGSYLGDTFDIVGMIENLGNKSFNELNLIAILYDKNNSLIDVERTVPFLRLINKEIFLLSNLPSETIKVYSIISLSRSPADS